MKKRKFTTRAAIIIYICIVKFCNMIASPLSVSIWAKLRYATANQSFEYIKQMGKNN